VSEAVATRTLLSVRDLHVFLGQSHVLQGVTFDVPEGGVTALLGRNGVGKTTTLRAILGLVGAHGSVRLDDDELVGKSTYRIVRLRIGYVPEDRDVFTGLTVAENLRLAERDAKPRYDLVYELFPELEERAAQRAGTLSGGQQQMVAIARALLNDNRVLLVDEPTKGLSPALVADVARVLERLAELTTVVLVEQNLGVVRRIARDAIVLDQGRVVTRAMRRAAQPPGSASSGGCRVGSHREYWRPPSRLLTATRCIEAAAPPRTDRVGLSAAPSTA
jgi:branched-chain amino acid transport system ATP-binding protein